MIPDGFQAEASGTPRAGASRPRPLPNTSVKQATSTGDVLAAALNGLGDRGITNPAQFASLGADAINGTVRWFDDQNGRVGCGVLVTELRAGGKPGYRSRRAATSDSQRRLDAFNAWCSAERLDPILAFRAFFRLSNPELTEDVRQRIVAFVDAHKTRED